MVWEDDNKYINLGDDVRVWSASDHRDDERVNDMITLDVKSSLNFLPKSVQWTLLIAAVVWITIWLKKIEPSLFPVISDFKIETVTQHPEGTALEGTMIKTRGCEFKEVVAYSGPYLVDVQFTETTKIVSRIEGRQAWGIWMIIPPVKELTLYARHNCATGVVETKLFEGLLIL